MGVLSNIMGAFGFGMGLTIGLIIGYYLFIYFQTTNVEDPDIRPLVEQDSNTLQSLLSEIPIWVKNPDHDRVDWLNKFIETMWPYLDKAICKTVKAVADPIIAEQIPKYKIDSIQFEVLSLGCLPPAFTGYCSGACGNVGRNSKICASTDSVHIWTRKVRSPEAVREGEGKGNH